MLAGLVDPGGDEPRTHVLAGHTIATYEPDARLSLVWPVPERDDDETAEQPLPEWAEEDGDQWGGASLGTVVVLLNGSPIWQERVWYLDWGSGVGGYVANFQPRFADDHEGGTPTRDGWDASAWSIGLARLLNAVSGAGDFDRYEPTDRLIPEPTSLHPVDAARAPSRSRRGSSVSRVTTTEPERDPLARRLDAAPLDDEPLTGEERDSLREAREDAAAGRFVSMDDLRRDLG